MNVNDMIYLGRLLPTNSDKIHQNQEVYSVDGIACCLKSTNYKDPPRVLVEEYEYSLFHNTE